MLRQIGKLLHGVQFMERPFILKDAQTAKFSYALQYDDVPKCGKWVGLDVTIGKLNL